MTTDKKIVLVVEDEQALSDIICHKLNQRDIATVSARSVQQAIDYIAEIPDISAVWLDHYLIGEDDGLVLASKLKSDGSQHKDMPIFVVSNTASDLKVRAYINLGVDKFIVKSNESLDSIVNKVIDAINAENYNHDTSDAASDDDSAIDESHVDTEDSDESSNTKKDFHSSNLTKDAKILIVEDEDILRQAIAEEFVNNGYNVIEAVDGQDGYEKVVAESPDAIVLDNEMPRLNGIGFLKKLQESFGNGTITGARPYVLILTNTSSIETTTDALQYGVHDYLIKADNPLSEVVKMVQNRLKDNIRI